MNIVQEVVDLLKQKKYKISTAESVTGGNIIRTIIEIPGASNVTELSYVVYSDSAKMNALGVSKQTIKQFGVVSKEVALEMARRLQELTFSEVCITTTGEAGPNPNEDNIPIGTICFGLIIQDKEFVLQGKFDGDRLKIIDDATNYILKQLLTYIK
jgi:nicotinamide-nucleotide amidase